ncbi:MAG: helix-turn-helix transcriptional regulator, partial [Anaerohalosphaera sp.]|nr:helix-turn-helix transcriptional regulator [Anaerohalosphaera sp.]
LKLTTLNVDHLRCDRSWHFEKVNSPFSRLYLVTGGLGQISHSGQCFDLKANTLHLIPAFTTHNCHCADWFDVYFVHFTCELENGLDLFSIETCQYQLEAEEMELPLFKQLVQINRHKKLTNTNPHAAVNKSIFTADRLDENMAPGSFMQSQGLLRILLARFLDTASDLSWQESMHDINRFSKVIQFIDENLSRPIMLSELSELVYLESGYFSNLFKNVMGVRPIEHINRKRIEKAQRLLLTTEDTLDNIARKTGLGNWTYLSRVFKKYVGVTPGKYRKQPHDLFR